MSTTIVVCAKEVGLFKIHMQLCNLLSKHFLMVRDIPLNKFILLMNFYVVSRWQWWHRILLRTASFIKLLLCLKLFSEDTGGQRAWIFWGYWYALPHCSPKQFSWRNLHPHLLGNCSISRKILFTTNTEQKFDKTTSQVTCYFHLHFFDN